MSKIPAASIIMRLEKSTKNTHVYVKEDTVIPTLYIRKDAFKGNPPAEISVTVEAVEQA
jgi:hypothetical protein